MQRSRTKDSSPPTSGVKRHGSKKVTASQSARKKDWSSVEPERPGAVRTMWRCAPPAAEGAGAARALRKLSMVPHAVGAREMRASCGGRDLGVASETRAMGEVRTFIEERCTVFVSPLHEGFTDDNLRSIFERFGGVAQHEVFRTADGVSRGFGLVRMGEAAHAAAAKKALSGTPAPNMPGVPLKVRWALETATLRVCDLSDVATRVLREAFQQFGDIVRCVVEREPPELGGQPRGTALVEDWTRAIAAKVLQIVSDNLLMVANSAKPVRCEFVTHDDDDEANARDPTGQRVHPPPHFAKPGTLEFDFALRWRELLLAQRAEAERMADLHRQGAVLYEGARRLRQPRSTRASASWRAAPRLRRRAAAARTAAK